MATGTRQSGQSRSNRQKPNSPKASAPKRGDPQADSAVAKGTRWGIENFPLVAVVIAIIQTVVTMLVMDADLITVALTNWLVWTVGAAGIWGAIGHLLMPDQTAEGIGWPTGSGFQREVGFANLGLGLAGLASILWPSVGLWFGTILVVTCFLGGAAYGHIVEVMKHDNRARFNAGLILYTDIAIPAVAILLFVLHLAGVTVIV